MTMRIFVHVVSPAAYQRFLKAQTKDLRAAQDYVDKAIKGGNVPGEGKP
jgi:hypothetical protein